MLASAEPMAELRSFIFLDQLQPQTMCYLGTWIRGRAAARHMAAQIIEVAPGLDIEPLTDVALKDDRRAGRDPRRRAPVRLPRDPLARRPTAVRLGGRGRAGRAGRDGRGRHPAADPRLASSMSRIDPQHAFLINRNKVGSMALAGRVAVRAGDAARVLRDPGDQRGGEGGAHQGRRLPHDRRHRAGLPDRARRPTSAPPRRPPSAALEERVSTGDEDLLRASARSARPSCCRPARGCADDACRQRQRDGHRRRGGDAVRRCLAPPDRRGAPPSGWRAPEPEADDCAGRVAFERVELRSDADLGAFVGASRAA